MNADSSTAWVQETLRSAQNIRRRVAEVCARNDGGYLIQACGSADILATLYTRVMDLGPSAGPLTPAPFPGVPRPGRQAVAGATYNGGRDRFLLSPAHYALALYATLCEVGRLGNDALQSTNTDGSTMEMIGGEHSPGFEATTGSLAQGLSVAVGQALARKRFHRPGHLWVLISDGELEEGQTWEAFQAAAHFGLDNLTVLIDANGLQVDGEVKNVMSIEPIAEKVAAFGIATAEVNGHDPKAVADAALERFTNVPRLVVCRTDPTRGVPSLRNRHQLHYIRFRAGEAESMLGDLMSEYPMSA